jgi:predicted phage tail protein
MTEIILHGSLSKEFKSEYKFSNIHKVMDCISAIDSVSDGFRNYVIKKARENLHYEFIVNDQQISKKEELFIKQPIKTIEIVPSIYGHNPVVAAFFVTLAVGLVVAGIQYLMTPIPEEEPQQMTAQIGAKSFLFASKDNLTAQYTPVPIGYGLLRVGSKIIESTVISRSTSQDRINASTNAVGPSASSEGGGTVSEYGGYGLYGVR